MAELNHTEHNLQRVAILGASRGLGKALYDHYKNANQKVFSVSRSSGDSKLDFSKPDSMNELMSSLVKFQPDLVFYCAAGGPHGLFAQKEWKDHLWSLQVSMIFPMQLVHAVSRELPKTKLVLIGSSIAEEKADPKASSYAAAKHALLGFCKSLWAEGSGERIWLLSPGYMDTQMLPKGAAPRNQPGAVAETARVVQQITEILAENSSGHYRINV